LRLLIYEDLIPNTMIISYDFHRSGILQYHRHDQQPCSPAMLRVNHQIYDELIKMWYETAEFHISIVGRNLYFLGDMIAPEMLRYLSIFVLFDLYISDSILIRLDRQILHPIIFWYLG
jgi:hypothetical protein